MIVGGREAAKVVDRLKSQGVAVVLRLNFPEEPRLPSEEEYRKRPPIEREEPRKVLIHRSELWKEQVATATVLARAGVPFAFATEGLDRLDRFPAQLRELIAAGLSADQALEALTRRAALIAGLDRRLGSLEPGKLGHVVAFSAPFQDEGARARVVLVDGLKFEIKPEEAGSADGRPGARRGQGPRGGPRPGSSADSPSAEGRGPPAPGRAPVRTPPMFRRKSERPPGGFRQPMPDRVRTPGTRAPRQWGGESLERTRPARSARTSPVRGRRLRTWK